MAKSFAGNASHGELYKLYMSANKFDIVHQKILESKVDRCEVRRMLQQHALTQEVRWCSICCVPQG